MKLILTGTGTSQGVPVITCNCDVCRSDNPKDKRLRTSAVYINNGNTIVIDAGPDFREQMLRHNIQKIDAVLITHQHHDHIGGMDDLRPFIFRQKEPMEIYAGIETIKSIRKKYYYAFEDTPYPGAPSFNVNQIQNSAFTINGQKIIPVFASHAGMPVWGFRLGNIAYLTDIKCIEPSETEKIKNLDILVINALRQHEHHSHFTLEEALELISELNPGKAYLTHISHDMGKHEDVSKLLPENVFLGFDGLVIE